MMCVEVSPLLNYFMLTYLVSQIGRLGMGNRVVIFFDRRK